MLKKTIVISESKKRKYTSTTGNRYRTKQVVYHYENGKKVNGKPALRSVTNHEPIFSN